MQEEQRKLNSSNLKKKIEAIESATDKPKTRVIDSKLISMMHNCLGSLQTLIAEA